MERIDFYALILGEDKSAAEQYNSNIVFPCSFSSAPWLYLDWGARSGGQCLLYTTLHYHTGFSTIGLESEASCTQYFTGHYINHYLGVATHISFYHQCFILSSPNLPTARWKVETGSGLKQIWRKCYAPWKLLSEKYAFFYQRVKAVRIHKDGYSIFLVFINTHAILRFVWD